MVDEPGATEGEREQRARRWFAVNAAVAWTGLVLQLVVSAGGFYPGPTDVPSLIGTDNPPGAAGVLPRVFDYFTYFTILSNIVVAVVLTALARGRATPTPVWRALRLDSVLMITITGLVYAVAIAPYTHQEGFEHVTNFFLHQATPVLTVLVWLVVGPRRWLDWPTVAAAMILPSLWVVGMLIRGAVIDAYPYAFVDVVQYGYGRVLLNLLAVLVIGLLLAAAFLGLDRWLSRRTRAATPAG